MFITTPLKRFTSGSDKLKYQPGFAIPVMVPDALWSTLHLMSPLKSIQHISEALLGENFYHAWLLPILNTFAEFVQVLPREPDGVLGELLARGVNRLFKALHVLQTQEEQDALIIYATATAALLCELKQVLVAHEVMIVDQQGQYLSHWCPFEEMMPAGGFYRLYPIHSLYYRTESVLSALLARQLLPQAGFLWIAAYPDVLASWLRALSNEDEGDGGIAHTLEIIRREEGRTGGFQLEETVAIEQIEQKDYDLGDRFLAWLRESIDKKRIKLNTANSPVQVVKQGVLIEDQLFKQFVDLVKLPVNFVTVKTQFGNLMGFIARWGDDPVARQYQYVLKSHRVRGSAIQSALGNAFNKLGIHTTHKGILLPKHLVAKSEIPLSTSTLVQNLTPVDGSQYRTAPNRVGGAASKSLTSRSRQQ